ncbi:MAG: hypothetical protein AAGE01_21885 [Pseudomonadota bacterium]
MSQILEELKRRNVFRVAIFYVVASWLVLQVGDLLFDLMGLPDWSLRIVLGVLVLAFPIVVIFAWAFEITPDGIKRERDVDRSQSITTETGRKLELSTIVLLLIVGGLLIYQQFLASPAPAPATIASEPEPAAPEPRTAGAPPDDLTLAVLPFRNISGDDENEYFVDGLSEELMNMLAGIESLRVAARTSAFSFKGKDVKVQEIGRELQVGHVLEGSLRKAGNRIRVSAQLIQTTDGFQLWSETFDRELDDVFALQDEIASNVADALRVELLGEAASPNGPDPAAFDRYLAGRFHLRQLAAGSAERAVQEFQRAIEIDPDYAAAWAGLADAYRIVEEYAGMPLEESRTLQEEAIERAEALDPGLPEVITARATTMAFGGRLTEALDEFEKVLKLQPNNSDLLVRAAEAAASLGQIKRHDRWIAEAARIDPLNVQVQSHAVELLYHGGDLDGAWARLAELERDWPNDPNVQDVAINAALRSGDAVRGLKHLQRLHELRPRDVFAHRFIHMIWKSLGVDDNADRWLALAEETAPDSRYVLLARDFELRVDGRWEEARDLWTPMVEAGDSSGFAAEQLAGALLYLGDIPGAVDRYEQALAAQGYRLDQPISGGQVSIAMGLAWAYLQLDQPEKASPLLDRLETYLVQTDAESVPPCFYYTDWAELEMLRGRHEAAIERLGRALDHGCWATGYLEAALYYEPLRGTEAFIAMKARWTKRTDALLADVLAAGYGLPPGT